MIRAMRREISKRASACVRNYAAGAGKPKASGETTDVVKRVFIEQQQKFRALLTKTKDLKPPVGGDAAAVKAYAAKKLAVLKEVRRSRRRADALTRARERKHAISSIGSDARIPIDLLGFDCGCRSWTGARSPWSSRRPVARGKVRRLTARTSHTRAQLDISTPGEKILETVDGAFAEAASVRGFLEYAGELRQMLGLKDEDDTMKVMVSALDETEKALGKVLMTSDAQGMAKYGTAVAKASEAAGIKPLDDAAMAKLQGEVDLESIENEIRDLQAVEDEVKKEQA